MKDFDPDELDNLIRDAVTQTTPLTAGFAQRTADKMLALHHRRQMRRLYAWGIFYFFLALAGTAGLACVINNPMAQSLLSILISYRYVFVLGMIVFVFASLSHLLVKTSYYDPTKYTSHYF
jgi:hypothetical protein